MSRERLSLGRIVRAMATGNRQRMTALEIRAMSKGIDSAGGFTVPDVISAQFIDRARDASVVFQAGAVLVPMTSDTLNLARLASGPALAWHAENAAITAGDLTLERVQFLAKTLPGLVKMSVELAEDSVNIDQIVERELSAALASELDRAALRGSGGTQPLAILGQTGVTILTNGTNGQAFSYDQLIDAAFAVATENFTPNARIYHSRVAKSAAKLKDSGGQYLDAPGAVAALKELVSNKVPINLVVGSASDTTELYVGDFRELMIGMRTSFRLEVTRTGGDSYRDLQVWVRAYVRADVQVGHGKAFAIATAVRP